MSMLRILILGALSAVALMLAAGTCSTAHTPNATLSHSSRSVLGAREIAERGYASRSLFDVVEHLRWEWLATRRDIRQGVVVYLGVARLGGAQELQEIPASMVSEVAYLSPAAAFLRFGLSCVCGSGVLKVELK